MPKASFKLGLCYKIITFVPSVSLRLIIETQIVHVSLHVVASLGLTLTIIVGHSDASAHILGAEHLGSLATRTNVRSNGSPSTILFVFDMHADVRLQLALSHIVLTLLALMLVLRLSTKVSRSGLRLNLCHPGLL